MNRNRSDRDRQCQQDALAGQASSTMCRWTSRANEFVVFLGAVRLRQIDAAAHDRRTGGGRRRRDPDRRPARRSPAPGRAARRHGVPALRALSAHDRARQHVVRSAQRAACRQARSTSASLRRAQMLEIAQLLDRKPGADLRRPATARRDRPRDREGAASCSCSTSRCPISMLRCACAPGSRSRSCTSASRRR